MVKWIIATLWFHESANLWVNHQHKNPIIFLMVVFVFSSIFRLEGENYVYIFL